MTVEEQNRGIQGSGGEPPMRSSRSIRRPTFSILTLLILTSLIATGVSHLKTSRELSQTRQELSTARTELAYIDAGGSSEIYAVALPTYGPMQWRWRIQLPKDGKYRIRSSFSSDVPESGFPAASASHNHVFLDSRAEPLAGGEPFILSLAIHKDESGQWVTNIQNPDSGHIRPIENPPTWLDSGSFLYWSTKVYGKTGTVSARATDPLPLLRYRKGKMVPGGVTVDMQPTDGMLFWIERVENR